MGGFARAGAREGAAGENDGGGGGCAASDRDSIPHQQDADPAPDARPARRSPRPATVRTAPRQMPPGYDLVRAAVPVEVARPGTQVYVGLRRAVADLLTGNPAAGIPARTPEQVITRINRRCRCGTSVTGMTAASPPHNITGLVLYIDTHIIDAEDDASVRLKRLWREGWIALQRTDAMDTELATAPPDKWPTLTEASAEYPEALGPLVLGHSRFDHTVMGSDEDAARLDAVFAALFPNVDRATARKNHLRDVMHVSTAIRYGGFGFVTREERLLNKAEIIAERFEGFRMWKPEQALAEAVSRIRGTRELHRREPHRGSLPAWPSDGELTDP